MCVGGGQSAKPCCWSAAAAAELCMTRVDRPDRHIPYGKINNDKVSIINGGAATYFSNWILCPQPTIAATLNHTQNNSLFCILQSLLRTSKSETHTQVLKYSIYRFAGPEGGCGERVGSMLLLVMHFLIFLPRFANNFTTPLITKTSY